MAAKARGVKFGPRPTLTPEQIAHACRLIDQDGYTVKEAAALFGVHRSTLYRAINSAGDTMTLADSCRAASPPSRKSRTQATCMFYDFGGVSPNQPAPIGAAVEQMGQGGSILIATDNDERALAGRSRPSPLMRAAPTCTSSATAG